MLALPNRVSLEDMQKLTSDEATYQTDPARVSPLKRMFASFAFYVNFIWIVLISGFRAKRGVYDSDSWQKSSIDVLRSLESVGINVSLTGLEHLKAVNGPAVIVGNHLSVMETVILPGFILQFKPVTFVIKQSLLEVPHFKHVMKSCDPIAVTRTNPRHDLKTVLDQGCERLARGISIIIFPQTTRATFNPAQFSTIAVKLAKKAGVPIIPLALLTDAWANGRRFKDFGKIDPTRPVHVAFGDPMTITGKGNEEHQAVIDFIQTHLDEWQAESES